MLTGVRTGELMKARWGNIDLENKEWFIPKQDTKTLEEWTIPLTDKVIKLFTELQGIDPVYVFSGKNGMLSDKAMGRAIRRFFESSVLTIDKVRPHDFRRTIRTHLEKNLNIAPHIAEKCLNHSLGAINASTIRILILMKDGKRWEAFLMLQINPQQNVTHIRQVS